MSLTVVEAIGCSQVLKLKAGFAKVVLWPFNAFRAQCIGTTDNIEQVPARVTALPLTRIRVKEIAIERVTGELIVKANAVVAGNTGTRLTEHVIDASDELTLWNTPALAILRRNSCNQNRIGVR